MQKQVIFRPDQHVKSADHINLQDFVRQSIDNIVHDAVEDGKRFYGLSTTKTGPTETTTDLGRLYSSGLVFGREVQTVFSHISRLPSVTQRIATVVVWGLEQEENIEPRAFVIDANASPPIFEPREVTMRRTRALQMDVVYGAESASPQRGVIDSNVLPVADILLDTTGVVSITMVDDNRLRSVGEEQEEIDALNDWRSTVGQQIDTLRSDMSKIEAKIPPDWRTAVAALARRIEEVYNLLRRPLTAFAGFVDRFVNEGDSDTAHAGYNARVEDGLRFPAVAPAQSAITLLNPLEPGVKTVNNITLPTWTEVPRLIIPRKLATSYFIITNFPIVTINRVRRHLSRRSVRYGDWLNCLIGAPPADTVINNINGRSVVEDQASAPGLAEIKRRPALTYLTAKRGGGEPYGTDFPRFWKFFDTTKIIVERTTRVCIDYIAQAYWPAVVATGTDSGATIAQGFLNSNSGWMTSVTLYFRDRAGAGDVKLYVMETTDGVPDENKVIAEGTLAYADIHTRDSGVRVPVTPVYLEGGHSFAVIAICQGAHSFWRCDGNEHSLCRHWYRHTSGAWVIAGAYDMAMQINMARFNTTRAEIQMNTASLAGGISAIRVMAASFIPPGTQLTWEVQNAGVWQSLHNGQVDALATSPTTLPLRAVFQGTVDLMPGIDLSQSELEVSRTNTALLHYSKNRDYGAVATDVVVDYYTENWITAHHTLNCHLIIGGVEGADAGTITRTPDATDPTKVKHSFKFSGVNTQTLTGIKTIGATDNITNGVFTVRDRWDHGLA